MQQPSSDRIKNRPIVQQIRFPTLEVHDPPTSGPDMGGMKPARLSPSAVVVHAAAAHPAVPSVNSRP